MKEREYGTAQFDFDEDVMHMHRYLVRASSWRSIGGQHTYFPVEIAKAPIAAQRIYLGT